MSSFIGAATFCLKACDPAGADAARFCDHTYDQIGCAYNSPAAYKNNTFESCEGQNQDFVGVYTSNGQIMTFTQPINSPITAIPYVPKIPASSNCATFQSTDLYNKPSSVAGDSSHGSDSNGGVVYLPVLSAVFMLPGTLAFLSFIIHEIAVL
ncbi:hypothetical protein FRC12_013887 [Ceratobasidium sp. 428]|nr:hypothetical protein FRC12_013887 [Ceratobasidium sp. 428]